MGFTMSVSSIAASGMHGGGTLASEVETAAFDMTLIDMMNGIRGRAPGSMAHLL